MALSDYFKGPQHKERAEYLSAQLLESQQLCERTLAELNQLQADHASLKELAKNFGAMEADQVRREIDARQAVLSEINQAVDKARNAEAELTVQIKALRDQVLVLEESILLESFALYKPKFNFTRSAKYKERLGVIRAKQKKYIKESLEQTKEVNWEVNGKKSEGRKLASDMMKLVMRSFNNECDYCVDNVKFDNVEMGVKRIRQSFETCNKLGRIMTIQLTQEYLDYKLEELYLAHEFQIKKQEEKEEAKRAREELREQQKLEQEIRAAREKIAKERKHFTGALKDLQARLKKAETLEEHQALQAKINEVEASRAALDGEEKLIDYREQNAKAGYVYVISNIGAFGEGVFKIGMTRRLDPMERIDELGDASVPFWFDVHAMVFSDNAPALEAKLHDRFAAGRLNKVNGRKEFFRATIEEIEAVIRQHFDPSVEVVHEAAAEQYRESLRMALPSAAIQHAEHAAAQWGASE